MASTCWTCWDHATPDGVPLARLRELLSPRLPRAYSIASHPCHDQLSLCVREARTPARPRALRHCHRQPAAWRRPRPGVLPFQPWLPPARYRPGTAAAGRHRHRHRTVDGPDAGTAGQCLRTRSALGVRREAPPARLSVPRPAAGLAHAWRSGWPAYRVLARWRQVYVQHVLQQRAAEVRDGWPAVGICTCAATSATWKARCARPSMPSVAKGAGRAAQ